MAEDDFSLKDSFEKDITYYLAACGLVNDETSSNKNMESVTKEYRVDIDSQNELNLPSELRRSLGIRSGAKLRIVDYGNKIEIYPDIHSLRKVYIEPTSDCNLSCQTCVRKTWNEPMGSMDKQVFQSIVDQLKAIDTVETVMFGGFGEPTFHRDICNMIGTVKSLGLKVEMTTNGTLLTEDFLKELIRNKLDTLWVSFDGTSTESFDDIRQGASFDALVQNLQVLNRLNKISKHKVNIGITFVVMKKNIHEIKNLGLLAKQVGAGRISISNVIPYSKDMIEQMVCETGISYNMGLIYPNSIPIDIPMIDKTNITKQPLYEFFSEYSNLSIMKNRISHLSGNCRFVQEGCTFIRWDGEVSPCMGLLHSYQTFFSYGIKRDVKHYSLGDTKVKNLKEIWESNEYKEFRERVDVFDFSPCFHCSACDLAEKNEEDCFGNNFPTCGGCLWAQGVIQCP